MPSSGITKDKDEKGTAIRRMENLQKADSEIKWEIGHKLVETQRKGTVYQKLKAGNWIKERRKLPNK